MRKRGKWLTRLWADESGLSSVEYVMLLAMIAGGIMIMADLLSGAVSNQMNEAAGWIGHDDCGNSGDGDGTGGVGGPGQGGAKTC